MGCGFACGLLLTIYFVLQLATLHSSGWASWLPGLAALLVGCMVIMAITARRATRLSRTTVLAEVIAGGQVRISWWTDDKYVESTAWEPGTFAIAKARVKGLGLGRQRWTGYVVLVWSSERHAVMAAGESPDALREAMLQCKHWGHVPGELYPYTIWGKVAPD